MAVWRYFAKMIDAHQASSSCTARCFVDSLFSGAHKQHWHPHASASHEDRQGSTSPIEGTAMLAYPSNVGVILSDQDPIRSIHLTSYQTWEQNLGHSCLYQTCRKTIAELLLWARGTTVAILQLMYVDSMLGFRAYRPSKSFTTAKRRSTSLLPILRPSSVPSMGAMPPREWLLRLPHTCSSRIQLQLQECMPSSGLTRGRGRGPCRGKSTWRQGRHAASQRELVHHILTFLRLQHVLHWNNHK